jgi:hypothetical protein
MGGSAGLPRGRLGGGATGLERTGTGWSGDFFGQRA